MSINIRMTPIYHEPRIKRGLSLIEYTVAHLIYFASINPKGAVSGWCTYSKKSMAKFIGISERSVFDIIARLESEFGLVERHPELGFTKTTVDWYDNFESCAGGMQNLQSGYAEFAESGMQNLHTLIKTNKDNKDNEPLDKFFEEIGVPFEPSDNPPPKNPAGKKKELEKSEIEPDVWITYPEYEKLIEAYGKNVADWMVKKLSNYKGATGKKYKSDYRAILNWVVDEARKHFRVPIEKQKESRKLIGHHHTIDYGTNKPIQIPVYEGDTPPRFGFVPLP